VHVNRRLLEEVDGPMLRLGLQEMHGRALILSARRVDRPDRDRLAQRFEAFELAV
jgi:putative restriction endonuclease